MPAVRVPCDDCGKPFPLHSPDQLIVARTENSQGQEIAPREWVFLCPRCFAQVQIFEDED